MHNDEKKEDKLESFEMSLENLGSNPGSVILPISQVTPYHIVTGYKYGFVPEFNPHFSGGICDFRRRKYVPVMSPEQNLYFLEEKEDHCKKIKWLQRVNGFASRGIITPAGTRCEYIIKYNKNFDKTIEFCNKTRQKNGEHNEDMWLNDEIENLYKDLHSTGVAHSIEVYAMEKNGNEELVSAGWFLLIDGMIHAEGKWTNKKYIGAGYLLNYGMLQLIKNYTKQHDHKINYIDMTGTGLENFRGNTFLIPLEDHIRSIKSAGEENSINKCDEQFRYFINNTDPLTFEKINPTTDKRLNELYRSLCALHDHFSKNLCRIEDNSLEHSKQQCCEIIREIGPLISNDKRNTGGPTEDATRYKKYRKKIAEVNKIITSKTACGTKKPNKSHTNKKNSSVNNQPEPHKSSYGYSTHLKNFFEDVLPLLNHISKLCSIPYNIFVYKPELILMYEKFKTFNENDLDYYGNVGKMAKDIDDIFNEKSCSLIGYCLCRSDEINKAYSEIEKRYKEMLKCKCREALPDIYDEFCDNKTHYDDFLKNSYRMLTNEKV